MKTILTTIALSLALVAPFAQAKGSKAAKGLAGKTHTGHSFPSKAKGK